VPEGHMLFYENADIPGVIGKVGTIMGSHQVNIAQMTCGRHKVGGRALTILNVDSAIPDPVLADLRSEDYITWAKPVSLE
jgi:D-3-phosphoglycerate dehydrogenase